MNFKADYHKELKEERERRKWTQKEVSEKIGISRSYYSDIENGRTLPSSKILFNINNVLPIFSVIDDANNVLPIFLAIDDADRVQEKLI